MKFSLTKYGWRCVLGAEIIYASCLAFGSRLNGADAELHHSLFELLPGFTWISAVSVLVGAIQIFIYAWIFAAYMVWMLNSSMEQGIGHGGHGGHKH